MGRVAAVVSLLIIGVSIYFRLRDTTLVVPTSYLEDHYWGLEGVPKTTANEAVTKFKVNVKQPVLDDLRERLNRTRLQDSLPGVNFEYGFHSSILKDVVKYWMEKYDWRKQEGHLNQLPQFTTNIEGINVHFIHVKPKIPGKEKKVILMVHGWPGSILEFYKVIPILVEAGFEVIAPSLPGYGFSGAPHRPGFSVMDAARVFAKLMARLSHDKFFYHGGDWGAIVGKAVSVLYPDRVLGYHTTMPPLGRDVKTWSKILIGEWFPSLVYNNELEAKKLHPLSKKIAFILTETGYFHLHATKPDTVGAALNDSPAGLAAYILEKFSTWVNPEYSNRPDGGLQEKFTMDELLTNVMIYWVNGCITSSNRLYKEYLAVPNFAKFEVTVPAGVLLPAHDLLIGPSSFQAAAFPDLVQVKELEIGGHFLAFEEPKLVAKDIIEFVDKVSARGIKE